MLFVPAFLYDNLSENIDNKLIKMWYNKQSNSYNKGVLTLWKMRCLKSFLIN